MEVLILGGTHHVGRNLVEVALERGDTVTTLNRGRSGPAPPAVRRLTVDRTDRSQLESALAGGTWDAVVDTWSGAPGFVASAAAVLAGRVGHYGYVSSRSVHSRPIAPDLDESGPVVEADPASTDETSYSRRKRGGELAARAVFGDRALLARAGLILGPYEQIGRLPWWLRRIERGGPVLAPGPADRPLQYIDGRDLAGWMLDMAAQGRGGAYNTVSRPGHTTMGSLLETCRRVTGGDAELIWRTSPAIEAAGIAAWTELPIWLPPEGEAAGLHSGDVGAAYAAGLACRPVADTVEATWRWMTTEGDPPSLAAGTIGLSADKERAALGLL
jgi:nucleoside-diphosphate-sugar epimerase